MIQKQLRPVILIELLLPLALAIFGVYHGVLQVFYRSGVIHDLSFLGIGYYQGLTAHGVMEPARLYESPFTDITPRGPDGLFQAADHTFLNVIEFLLVFWFLVGNLWSAALG